MSKQIIVSNEGLLKLQDELEHLKTVKRKEVAQAIQKARSFGDLSENSEYDEAKNEQAEIEGKIAQLEETLKYATVFDGKGLGIDKVAIGNKVTVENTAGGAKVEYKIVSTAEADPLQNRVSDESPLGKALLNQKKGEIVSVESPVGTTKYKIVKISK